MMMMESMRLVEDQGNAEAITCSPQLPQVTEAVAAPCPFTTDKNGVTLVPVTWLKPHEHFIHARYLEVLEETVRAGGYHWPIVVDRQTGVILDGHHRHQVSLTLRLHRVPAVLVDYLHDHRISVERWREEGLTTWFPSASPGSSTVTTVPDVSSDNLFPTDTTHALLETHYSRCDEHDERGDVVMDRSFSSQSLEHSENCAVTPKESPVSLKNVPASVTVNKSLSALHHERETTLAITAAANAGSVSTLVRELKSESWDTPDRLSGPPPRAPMYDDVLACHKETLSGARRCRFHGTDVVVLPVGDDEMPSIATAKDTTTQQTLSTTSVYRRSVDSACPQSTTVQGQQQQFASQRLVYPELAVTKEMVIRTGLTGNLYPPKSSRHIMPAELYDFRVFYALDSLREPNGPVSQTGI